MSSLGRSQRGPQRNAISTRTAVGGHRRAGNTHSLLTVRPTILLLVKALCVPLASAAPLSLWPRSLTSLADDEEPPKSASDPDLYIYLSVAVFLVLLGGVFAGLTIAFMGQDETYLQVMESSGEGKERKHAAKVLNLLKKGKHWVLVTLLLGNVITNETLPIVLDRSLGGGWPAVVSSTVLIVIFGEIAPQSVCVRFGLSIGAFMAPFVLALMWLLSPVAWPTAKLLDWLLGEDHGTTYKKAGLKSLVQLHKTLGTTPGERLMEDEVTIINSVLDLKDKPVGDIMTPMQDVFTMSADTVLDERMMDTILSQGYSRIPIYAPDNHRNFIGMLLVKILITYDPEDATRVRDFSLATLPETLPHTSCLDIINFFQEGKSHMVLVSDFPGDEHGALGVVTLEDVIEELIGEEIIDESDVFVDVHKAIRRLAPAPRQRLGRTKTQAHFEQEANDQDQEAGEDEPLLRKDGGSRRSSLNNGRPPTAYLRRRKSSNASDPGADLSQQETVPVAANPAEMKEHLKRLGPSNAASKPRATKYTSVKIKPGVGTIPEGQATTKGIDDRQLETQQRIRSMSLDTPNRNVANDPGESEVDKNGLPTSAGRNASGGAAALTRAGYGTMSGPNSPERPRTRGASTERHQMTAQEASKVAEEKAAEPAESDSPARDNNDNGDSSNTDILKVPEKLVVGETPVIDDETSDQIGDMAAPSRDRRKSKHATRSGSITETQVDVNGMKKTVLGTTSSNSSEPEDGEASKGENGASVGENGEVEDQNEGVANGEASDGKKKRKKKGKKGR